MDDDSISDYQLDLGTYVPLETTSKKKSKTKTVKFICCNAQRLDEFRSSHAPITHCPQLMQELLRNDVDVLALHETRWLNKEGQVEWKDPFTGRQYTCFYSGNPLNSDKGVALVIKQEWVPFITKVKYVSDKIIWVLGKFLGIKTQLISVFAPSNDASIETKDAFYLSLFRQLQQATYYERKVVMGGFRACIGRDRERVWSTVRGQFNIRDEMNDNGERLLAFCAYNNLFLANTIQKSVYASVGTLHDPATKKWTTVDHILVPKVIKATVSKCTITPKFKTMQNYIPMELVMLPKAVYGKDHTGTKESTLAMAPSVPTPDDPSVVAAVPSLENPMGINCKEEVASTDIAVVSSSPIETASEVYMDDNRYQSSEKEMALSLPVTPDVIEEILSSPMRASVSEMRCVVSMATLNPSPHMTSTESSPYSLDSPYFHEQDQEGIDVSLEDAGARSPTSDVPELSQDISSNLFRQSLPWTTTDSSSSSESDEGTSSIRYPHAINTNCQ